MAKYRWKFSNGPLTKKRLAARSLPRQKEKRKLPCLSPNPRRKVFENSRHVRARGNSTKEKRKDRKKKSGKRGSAGEREQKEIKERRRSIFLWTVEQPPCDYPGRGAYMSNLYSARSSVSKFEST